MSTMEGENSLSIKKSLKWYESRIEDFNNTVPFQISVLQNCKSNMLKLYRLGNFNALKQERITAERTIRHLKQLIKDCDKLREQVRNSDLNRFDKSVSHSRESIDTSLKSFTDFCDTLYIPSNNVETNQNRKNYAIYEEELENASNKQILLYEPADVWEQKQYIETAQSMEKIQRDVQTVNEIFQDLSKIVEVQKEHVDTIEKNVEVSHERVVAAEKELAQAAAKIHGAAYPLVGAVLGSCVGGPVGLLAGLKIGSVVAITGSLLGFSGGKALKMKQQKVQKEALQNAQIKQVDSTDRLMVNT